MQAVSRLLPFAPLLPSRANNNLTTHSSLLRTARITASSTKPHSSAEDTLSSAFWDYQSLFLSQRRESLNPIPLRLTEGFLPLDFPQGTYYLTGPGIFTDDHGSTVHPLDGHGYLRAFRLVDGEVTYAARYVATEALREERDEVTGRWRFTYRGPFSVLRGGRKVGNAKVMKNVANTSVVRWGGKLLCLWEGGDPYEIDPDTMETIGPFDVMGLTVEMECGGVVGAGLWGVAARVLRPVLCGLLGMTSKRVLSHYKIDAKRRRLIVLSCNCEDMLLPCSNFSFYEFDEDFKLVHNKHFCIRDHLMIHDWAFTENNYIIIGNRIKIDVLGSVLAASGLSPMITALSVNPSRPTTPIYVLPRFADGLQWDWRRPVEASEQMWALHMSNAFEKRDENGNGLEIQFHVTTCSYQWFDFHRMFGYNFQNGRLSPLFMNTREDGRGMPLPHLAKVSIMMDKEANVRECSICNASLSQCNRASDLPAINMALSGCKNAYTYLAMASGTRQFLPHFPFDSIAKVCSSNGSVELWTAGHRRFVGEPVFVPRGKEEEDDGYILVVEYAIVEQRCYLVILDASHIGEADAVVAKFEIPKDLTFPLGFHGFWDMK